MGSGGEVHMRARGWRAESQQGGVWRQAVWGLVMGLCVGAVAGAPAAMQPSSSSSADNGAGGEVGCERPITDVMLGFGLSLLAVFVAAWNALQFGDEGKLKEMIGSFLATLLGPISILMENFEGAFKYVPTIRHLHKMNEKEMTIARIWAMLNPLSKSPARFLASCVIFMYFQEGEQSVLLENSWIWEETIWGETVGDETEAMVVGEKLKFKRIDVEDGSEAMVVGEEPEKTEKIRYERKQLSANGKAVLLWGEYFSPNYKNLRILPKYGELKFLRANSGFAVIAIGIQAIGYIYAVIFRSANDLRVAPVEVIGLVINIMLLIGVILYGMSNPCSRPLVIYMDKDREGKFVNALQSRPEKDFKVHFGFSTLVLATVMFLTILFCISILVYFIVTLQRATNIMIVLPIIIFAATHLLSYCLFCLYLYYNNYLNQDIFNSNWRGIQSFLFTLSTLSNLVTFVWAVIVTFHYWKSQHFNTRPQSFDLSQLIPFIG
ncbi:hypothetical protein KC19_2G203200 [Ceratodon purpureus]|uniref:Uncharacterized protein n=1 Tax=Ceratodon purpureus TaxID=3225 RepID=A0A8T0IZ57_CERPU|nr:hypothetical protein KC19_2G203200 [Ceratodon purpureus]